MESTCSKCHNYCWLPNLDISFCVTAFNLGLCDKAYFFAWEEQNKIQLHKIVYIRQKMDVEINIIDVNHARAASLLRQVKAWAEKLNLVKKKKFKNRGYVKRIKILLSHCQDKLSSSFLFNWLEIGKTKVFCPFVSLGQNTQLGWGDTCCHHMSCWTQHDLPNRHW